MQLKRPCPVCEENNPDILLELEFGGFDQSYISRNLRLAACRNCGMVYDEVADPENLNKYYLEQGFYGSFQAPDSSLDTGQRHRNSFDILKPYLSGPMARWVDVGCSQGALLRYLKTIGYERLAGVDLFPASLERLAAAGIEALKGSAEALPLADGSVEVLSSCHNLEHLYNLSAFMTEAKRVLKPGGLLYLILPDAEYYGGSECYQKGQWLLPEHINHFSLPHLEYLAVRHGFQVLAGGHQPASAYWKVSKENHNHAAYIVAAKQETHEAEKARPDKTRLAEALREQMKRDDLSLAPHREIAADLIASGRPLYFWGMTLSFWNIYGRCGLGRANIKALVDKNPYFHKYTVDKRPIEGLEAFERAQSGDLAVIFSPTRRETMQDYLREINFPGESLVLI